MIPWVREKFAERRARWQASRKPSTGIPPSNSTTSPLDGGRSTPSTSSPSSAAAPSTPQLDNAIQIVVYSPLGQRVNLILPITMSGYQVKTECVRLFADSLKMPHERKVHADNFKLLKARIEFELNERMMLEEAKVRENDEFLLVRVATTDSSKQPLLKGPTQDDIEHATRALPPCQTNELPIVNIEELVLQSDVQYDIRQILISLAETSAYVIGTGAHANSLIVMLKSRLLSKKCHGRGPAEHLVGMGFSVPIVSQALIANSDDCEAALGWLIAGPAVEKTTTTNEAASQMSRRNITALLNIIRIYCHMDVPPQPDMIRLIRDMGFAEPDVIAALKITKNNHSAACDWLIGNRTKTQREIDGDANGLATDSPILHALLRSSHVQLSLSNPKIFIAYLAILEDYSSMSMWLGDGETSGIIGHILRTYHEEKHILAINQFSTISPSPNK